MSDATPIVPPRRRRRWWLRILLILVGFVVVLVVLVQAFLWSDYPRRIAEAQVTNLLGVRTSIERVSIGWLGRTTIDGLALTLPMEREPFLRVDRVRATHTSLPLIAFAQVVSDAEVDGVRLDLRQDANGRWNLESLLPPASNAATQPASASARRNPLADLPDVRAGDVRVSLTRADGRSVTIEPIAASLRKLDPLLAAVDARLGPAVAVSGQLGLVAAMPQELRLSLASIPPDLAAFFGLANPPSLSGQLSWSGRRTGDGIAGTLTVDRLALDALVASGRVDVEQGGAGLTLRPVSLAAGVGGGAVADVKLTAGRIVVAGPSVRVEQLRGTLNGGRFAAQGRGDLASQAARLTLEWEQVRRADLTSTGTLTVETLRTLAGRLGVVASARGEAVLPAGRASGEVVVRGEGDAPDAFAADVDIRPLTWVPTNGASVVVPALRGTLAGRGASIDLAAFGLADVTNGTLNAYGSFDTARKVWWATLDAGQLTSPLLATSGIRAPLDLSVVADGTLARVDVRRVYAKLDRGTVWARGEYDFAVPRPLRLETWAWYDKPTTEDEAARLNSLRAAGVVEGVLAPRDLTVQADVSGTELVFAGRPFGDVEVHLTANVDQDVATVRSRDMQVLGGTWSLRGDWSRASGRPPTLVASVVGLPLASLGEVVDRDDVTGTIDRGTATLTLRSTRLDQIEAVAGARGTDLRAGPLHADALELAATLKGGRFEVRPTLREKAGRIDVVAGGDVRMATPVKVDVTLLDWPAPALTRAAAQGRPAERFSPTVSGTVGAEVSVTSGEVSADVDLRGTLARDGVVDRDGVEDRDAASLAGFDVQASLQRRQFTLARARVQTLDGTITASGAADLGDLNTSAFDVELRGLVPSRLAWLNPLVQEVKGELDGTISMHPARGERPLGPAQLEVALRPSADANYKGVQLGAIDVNAFVNIDSLAALRLVTHSATLNLAGGTLEPFARVSRQGPDGWSQLVTVDFNGLDLGQLVRAVDDDGAALSGKLGGRVQLFGNAFALARLNGDATVNISQSDLANFGPVSALYNALSVGTSGTEPDGTGSVSLRVGEGVLSIDDASYFNRGVYASGFGTVREIDKLPESALDLTLFGSLQPLRAVKLPFFGDVNDTFAALQGSVTAIRATGTLKEPQAAPVALSGLGDAARKILLGKAKGQD